ncbi:transcription-repair coupling factor [Cardinium endosymbiont of Oedothorax gibbosus]|uniref:transcription-repair coupling factor n=1 Tax=Cardinium endosymbiont of Oedothorax gibbosus TaxID=931101 RepID=UPI0020250064|nr:transcription-repair coupling factor [Cardinium endosymbiont of Oedothorax gibbosus]CAH2559933.1 Transcription-repair-coupling factor [Cardinium endosymbiont of Oedothorax gibbosus]
MQINDFIALYQKKEVVAKLTDYLKQDPKNIHLQGIQGSLDALLIAALQQNCNQVQLVVVENKEEALAIYGDLTQLLPAHSVLLFPSFAQKDDKYKTIQYKRSAIIHAISENQSAPLVVTHITALLEKILDPSLVATMHYRIDVGQTLSIQTLENMLGQKGFTKVDFVYSAGQFAIRGGIIDVYTMNQPSPYRIELWGDQVSTIRIFDPKDQKSFKKTNVAIILANHETAAEKQLVYTSFAACLPTGSCIWLKNKKKILEELKNTASTATRPLETMQSFMASIVPFHQILFGPEPSMVSDSDLVISYNAEKQPCFQQNFTFLADDLYKRNQQNYDIYITATATGQFARLTTILEAQVRKTTFTPLLVSLREGYIDHTAKIVCYSDHQIFNRYYRYQLPKRHSTTETLLADACQKLEIGDYVVHSDHGVGRFSGLHSLHINGEKQEAIRLIYKNNDMVYVNVHELYKISKYTSKDGTTPSMHTLGTSAWKRKKDSIKKQIKDIAKELITLYAERKKTKGFAFGEDTLLDAKLAASFCYEETPDQAMAIASIKADMQRPTPMDRLVCGDVGFGKTEIAIRAAFKAAAHGKQAAVLVPTTILALQHYNSFINRLANLPIHVSYINRFKTKQEIEQTLADTASGKVDILIGTHKLLSNGVKFKDLGLLIIDEEQKFGVSAKERLKKMRLNVDTLTLTATPIPRTLHFSLMGARDLSILTTPPTNRLPIQTKLHRFDDKLIKEAIEDEIAREGQVFFVHNKVSNINAIAQNLSDLLPTARICVAHGQMAGSMLEEKILQFIVGRYDILVATSIIESGMDMPNVNTIIVNDSHLLGLSDLHQMRGRVGRSNVQAFCYLLIPENITLTPEAKLRLAALEECSALGDGFKLAMRDLDIRGVGDLLGASQSGFISDIGFETYCKILEEAVDEVKHTDFKTLFEARTLCNACSIETDCEALLPSEYVQSTAQRMTLYTRLNALKNINQLTRFKEELIDRFGSLPTATETLLETVQLRWESERIGFQKISFKSQRLHCYLSADFQKRNLDMWNNIMRYMQQHPACCQLKRMGQNLILTITGKIHSVLAAKELLATIGAP